MKLNVSGQFLYFPLISAISGNLVRGIVSGGISGFRSTDGASGIVLSGPVFETNSGCGLYKANLFDWDTSGAYLGFMFTASGCVPQCFSVETEIVTSGRLFPASGVNTVVPSSSLSGLVANSGLTINVILAQISGNNSVVPVGNLSGIIIQSGAFVQLVTAAQLSGITPVSGHTVNVPLSSISGNQSLVNITTLSGIQPISGIFVSVPLASVSGIQIASGSLVGIFSGQLSGQILNLQSGLSYPIIPIASISGNNSVIPVQNLSGISIASGQLVALFSGQQTAVVSGTQVNTFSGQQFLQSGVATSLSGLVGASGIFATVPSGNIWIGGPTSGITAGSVSGTTYLNSGAVTAIGLSGIVIQSGAFVQPPPISALSGISVVGAGAANTTASLSGIVPSQVNATLSGINVIIPSQSGLFIGNTSGYTASLISGTTTLNSGAIAAVGSGLFVSVVNSLLSGINVIAPIPALVTAAQLSGVVPASGGFVQPPPISALSGISSVVLPAGLSGIVPTQINATLSGISVVGVATSPSSLSGLTVSVVNNNLSGISVVIPSQSGLFIGNTSGFTSSLISGTTTLASGSIYALGSGLSIGSGATVGVVNANLSGINVIAPATSPSSLSGVFAGNPATSASVSGVNIQSGAYVQSPPISSLSGINSVVLPAQLSGLVGASGIYVGNPSTAASLSGLVNSQINSTLSGISVVGAANTPASLSGVIYGNSLVTIAQLSGITVASGGFVQMVPGILSGLNIQSGAYPTILIANLSGLTANSGLTTTTILSTISGVNIASGQNVNLFSGNQVQVWSGTSVNTFSGAFTNASVTIPSGTLYPASGIFASIPIASISGNQSLVNPITLSGVIVNSGLFVTTTLASGQVFLASGSAVSLNSGQLVQLYSGQQVISSSGANVVVASGATYLNSGAIPAQVTPASLSGIFIGQNSGLFMQSVSGTEFGASGQNVVTAVNLDKSGYQLSSGSFTKFTYSSGTLSVEIPYSMLRANMSGVTGEAEQSLLNALRKLVNHWDTTSLSGFLSVYKEDGLTLAYAQAIGSTSGSPPITSLGEN